MDLVKEDHVVSDCEKMSVNLEELDIQKEANNKKRKLDLKVDFNYIFYNLNKFLFLAK